MKNLRVLINIYVNEILMYFKHVRYLMNIKVSIWICHKLNRISSQQILCLSEIVFVPYDN